jgi:magnesium transporter
VAIFSKRYHPPGTAPGTLTEHRTEDSAPMRIRLVDYTTDRVTVSENVDTAACEALRDLDTVTWIHVQGSPTEAALRELGAAFDLHALALEDALNTGQRPKVETFADQLFLTMTLSEMNGDVVDNHQVSLFFGPTWVISFCAVAASPFDPIVARLHDAGSRLRKQGADFLLDAVIDAGFPLLERFSLHMEDLEQEILDATDRSTLERIHVVKRELILLRRMLWPQRDVINQLLRDDHQWIRPDTLLYLRDCYDHTIQIMDLLESYRDMSASMLDIYLSSVSNHMNDIMRVLTVIATLFIPLTFIVGVYGMNFDRAASPWNMPELGSPYGYPLLWTTMLLVAGGMLLFFRRRGWF